MLIRHFATARKSTSTFHRLPMRRCLITDAPLDRLAKVLGVSVVPSASPVGCSRPHACPSHPELSIIVISPRGMLRSLTSFFIAQCVMATLIVYAQAGAAARCRRFRVRLSPGEPADQVAAILVLMLPVPMLQVMGDVKVIMMVMFIIPPFMCPSRMFRSLLAVASSASLLLLSLPRCWRASIA